MKGLSLAPKRSLCIQCNQNAEFLGDAFSRPSQRVGSLPEYVGLPTDLIDKNLPHPRQRERQVILRIDGDHAADRVAPRASDRKVSGGANLHGRDVHARDAVEVEKSVKDGFFREIDGIDVGHASQQFISRQFARCFGENASSLVQILDFQWHVDAPSMN